MLYQKIMKVRYFYIYKEIGRNKKNNYLVFFFIEVSSRMPFNSTEKFALTIVELNTPTSDYCVYIKGAPEKIWKLSSFI